MTSLVHVPTFSEETKAIHSRLSSVNARFLEFIEQHPQCLSRGSFAELDDPNPLYPYPYRIQSWPTFVGGSRFRELKSVAIDLAEILRTVPLRFFDGVGQVGQFYGLGDDADLVLDSVTALGDAAVGRGDFVDTPDGFMCVEFNLAGGLGGWQMGEMAQRVLAVPIVAQFVTTSSVRLEQVDVLRELLRHVAADVRRWLGEDGCNLAVVVRPEDFGNIPLDVVQAFVEPLFVEIATQAGLRSASLSFCHYEALAEKDELLVLGDKRIHAIAEYYDEPYTHKVHRAMKSRAVRIYDGPSSRILHDKRNLAMVSACEDGRLTERERQLIARHVPWTRPVTPEAVRFDGQTIRMAELLASGRTDLVLKKGISHGGVDVVIGRGVAQATWDAAVERALLERDWVVQRRVDHVPYVYQSGQHGCAVHDLVWGVFVCSATYAGTSLRMKPAGQDSTVSATAGADYGVVVETADEV